MSTRTDDANGKTTRVSFTTFMQLYKEFKDPLGGGDITPDWRHEFPEIVFEDYTDFVNGAALLRGLCKRGIMRHDQYPIDVAVAHARLKLKEAIEAEDWDMARAWLRPGIAHHHSTYNACERDHQEQLGDTAREGRADGLRQSFWCILVQEAIPLLISPRSSPDLQNHMARLALFELDEINKKYRLDRVDLSDDRFGDGTVLEVWMNDLHPHLIHCRPEFMQYEAELRSRSPLPFHFKLALAEGLHSRLGASSNVRLLSSDLVKLILDSDTTQQGARSSALQHLIARRY